LGIGCNATKVLSLLGIDLAGTGFGEVTHSLLLRTATGRTVREVRFDLVAEQLGGHPLVSIRRQAVLDLLRAAVPEATIHFGARVERFETDDDGVSVSCADGRTATADVLIGADGIRSAVRTQLAGPEPTTDHGYINWLAVIPFRHERLAPGVAAHYWGVGQRFGLIDIGGGDVYWWATRNMPNGQSGSRAGGKDYILTGFDGWAEEVVGAITATPAAAVVAVPAQDRPFRIRWGTGPVTLLGDAAHPMLTSLGQGAGSAIEDAYVLAHELACEPDPLAALRSYEVLRRKRTRRLVAGSRRLSRIEQLGNPVLAGLRDIAFRFAPSKILQTQTVQPMRFDLPA
jgi:2-polyprenyl-6-methoxyphenol hydroxylase-like FAD-dependent oxidoreductase